MVTPAGDGDAFLEPGETGSVAIPVTNRGDGEHERGERAGATDDPRATITAAHPELRRRSRAGRRSRGPSRSSWREGYPLGRPVRLDGARHVRRHPVADQDDAHGPDRAAGDDPAGVLVHRPGAWRSRTTTTPASRCRSRSRTSATPPRSTFSVDGTTCTTTAGADDGRDRPHVRRRSRRHAHRTGRADRHAVRPGRRGRQQPVPGRVRRRGDAGLRRRAVQPGARSRGAGGPPPRCAPCWPSRPTARGR